MLPPRLRQKVTVLGPAFLPGLAAACGAGSLLALAELRGDFSADGALAAPKDLAPGDLAFAAVRADGDVVVTWAFACDEADFTVAVYLPPLWLVGLVQ